MFHGLSALPYPTPEPRTPTPQPPPHPGVIRKSFITPQCLLSRGKGKNVKNDLKTTEETLKLLQKGKIDHPFEVKVTGKTGKSNSYIRLPHPEKRPKSKDQKEFQRTTRQKRRVRVKTIKTQCVKNKTFMYFKL